MGKRELGAPTTLCSPNSRLHAGLNHALLQRANLRLLAEYSVHAFALAFDQDPARSTFGISRCDGIMMLLMTLVQGVCTWTCPAGLSSMCFMLVCCHLQTLNAKT